MNSASFRRSPANGSTPVYKRTAGRKRKGEINKDDCSVCDKSKKMKRNRRRTRKSSKFMEYAEYEYSGTSRQVQTYPSDTSIMYIDTYQASDMHIPIIDLTKSTHSITCSPKSSLKLLYKCKNFNQQRFQKRAATSLLTIPKNHQVNTRNVNSASNLLKSTSKSLLEIFPIYFDDEQMMMSDDEVLQDFDRPDLMEQRGVGMMGDEEDPSFHLESKQPMENLNGRQSFGDGS